MGLLRRGRPATEADALEISDDVFVVSPRAADLAVSAQKERRKAARAERLLAETPGGHAARRQEGPQGREEAPQERARGRATTTSPAPPPTR